MFESFAAMALFTAIAALRRNMAIVVGFLCLCVGYCLVGIPQLAYTNGPFGWDLVSAIGGWFLCASAAVAYYYGAALLVNSTFGRTLLPIAGEA